MAFKSRKKGNAFELRVAKVLNEALQGRGLEWTLSRTPASGGIVQFSKTDRFKDLRADLLCTDDSFPLFIECKNREGWSFDQILKLGLVHWEPMGWYREAGKKASVARKTTCLIFTRNRLPDFVMMHLDDIAEVTGKLDFSNSLFAGTYVFLTLEVFAEAFASYQQKLLGKKCR